MNGITKTSTGWQIVAGNLILDIDKKTGSLSGLCIDAQKQFNWTEHPGDVTVRDDLLRKTFDRRDLQRVEFSDEGGSLSIKKVFQGAPWLLEETYAFDGGAISWNAEVMLDSGEFRSCAVSYNIPWPQPLYPVSFWAAKDNMPSAPHRFAEIALEYGEVTSGITIPALSSYIESENAGLLLAMPFDFCTPRFRFISGYRDPDLQTQFDWMALAPGRPARASLLLRGTPGAWRPALGWLYERFTEYFEPRSTMVDRLWGGHVSGTFDVSVEDAEAMARLGLKWHEVHAHYPAYGNYCPEGISEWRSGHDRDNETIITSDMVRRTIRNLQSVGAAAMLYLQVTGDGDEKLLDPAFDGSRIRDLYGNLSSAWPGTYLMNSDPALPFGKDMVRQIDCIVTRYPDMDGIFLDQPSYNFLDTAHGDGISAVNNRPVYMTGFNYFPHLEHLSSLLHPHKAIISNGGFGIGIMKYIDGFMAEGSGWLCDHFQYYGLAKPLFFLMYESGDADIERMFQQCLLYAAGFTSYTKAAASSDLYAMYVPLLQRLFRRRWVFDPKPISFPTGLNGGVFRSSSGSLVASIVGQNPAVAGRTLADRTVCVRTADIDRVQKVTLHSLGAESFDLPFLKEDGAVQFDVPYGTVAAVAEM